jgi:hypothetical protein
MGSSHGCPLGVHSSAITTRTHQFTALHHSPPPCKFGKTVVTILFRKLAVK